MYLGIPEADKDDYELTVSYTDFTGAPKTVTVDGADLDWNDTYGKCEYAFTELTPMEVGTLLTVTVTDKTTNTVEDTDCFSVSTFCYYKQNDAYRGPVCHAIMNYGACAAALFTALNN